ncbi:CD320 antigen [Manis javanica]|nr:CD320 antigen [Manis javanica]
MAPDGARCTAVLGLALRLLLGFGMVAEAAPTRSLAHTPGSCPPSHFQCRTPGFCVPLAWRCDGDPDCPEDSEEEECGTELCAQDGLCPPPTGSPCSCDSMDDCPDGIDKSLYNCSSRPCPAGELRCPLGTDCIPHTWFCDGHPDCPSSSDELGCGTDTVQEENATSMGTPVTLENITYATATSPKDQDSGNPSARAVMAAAVMLSAGLVAAALFVLSRLCAQGRLYPLRLLMKRSVLLSARRTSLL